MIDRRGPLGILKGEIAELERELATALAACPEKQRYEMESLRQRLDGLKSEAMRLYRPHGTAPR